METNENYQDDHFRDREARRQGRDERRQAREEYRQYRHEHHSGNRPIIGVILVLIGLFLVMRNTGIFPDFIDHVIFSWPMLLVAIGLVMTLGASEKTSGIIVMAVGAFFMIPLIFRETFHAYNMFWPSIFIIIGIIFITTKRHGWNSYPTKGILGDDFVDYVNVFGGTEHQIISENFRGGRLSAVFGGMELDLTKARLAPGSNVLDIACVFGGVSLIVPDDWDVIIHVTPVLGGFSDSRKLIPGRSTDPSKQLVIKGAVVFGGGEVKSHK